MYFLWTGIYILEKKVQFVDQDVAVQMISNYLFQGFRQES